MIYLTNTEIMVASAGIVGIVCAIEHFVVNRKRRIRYLYPPLSNSREQELLHVDPRITKS